MMESLENHRARKIAVTQEFPRIARDIVSPKSQSCDDGCRVFVVSHTEESPDENRSKRSKLSGRERRKTADDVKLRVQFSPELPVEIIEKIISLIPFPRILTARALSNEWRLKLCARASNTESVMFREMVKFAGARWPVYFPLAFDVINRVIIGLDRSSWTWVTLWKESLDFEAPRTSNPMPWKSAYQITGLGTLVCIATKKEETRKLENPEEFCVYNVFTRAWKWLPPRPACEWLSKPGDSCLLHSVNAYPIYLIPDGPESYKVLVLENVYPGGSWEERKIVVYLYESRSSSWTIRVSSLTRWLSVCRRGAYSNGVIYFDPMWAGPELLQYSVYIVESGYLDERMFLRLRLRKLYRILKFIAWENQLLLLLLLSCGSRDDMEHGKLCKNSFILFKVDPVTGYCGVIYTGPPEPIPKACSRLCLWHGDSIFFEDIGGSGNYLMEFNIRKHTWTLSSPISRRNPYRHLVWSSTTFEPGKNPFIIV